MPLDTLTNVKTRIGVSGSTDDTLLGLLQDSADRAIERFCDRDFAGGTFTEYHPGGTVFLHLRNYPVDTVTSVKVDGARVFGAESVLDPSRYVVHADRGVIQSVNGPFLYQRSDAAALSPAVLWSLAPRVVQVVYTTLTNSVPADIREAYARLVAHWYRQVKTDTAANFQNVQQQKYGETFVIFGRETRSGIPADVAALLESYRLCAV